MKLDKQITMPKVMKMITAIGILVTLVTMIIYQNNNSSIFLTLAITFGTITYHFGMRLLIGWLVMILMKNKADYTKQWYQLHSWEKAFYKKIKIKCQRIVHKISHLKNIAGMRLPRQCVSQKSGMS